MKYPTWNGNINNGTTGDWDLWMGTLNWKEYSTGVATAYLEGPPSDAVYFEDSAIGVTNVNVTTTVQPLLVTVNNNTKNYTFSGIGNISGATALVKNGTGTLSIANSNDYTGGTIINAGTLQIGDGGSSGQVAGNIVNNSALSFNRSDTGLIVSNVISGTGTVTQSGSGMTTLSGANTYTGDTVIANGWLTLGTTTTLQTSTLDSQGGTLSFGTLTSATLGGLKGSQGIALANDSAAAVSLTVGNNNADTTYAGALTGIGSLSKNGTGTLTLTGSNAYTGNSGINRGNIVVSGTGGLNTGANMSIGRTDYNANAGSLTFRDSATGTFSGIDFGGNLRSGGTFTIQDSASVVVNGNFDLNNEIAGSSVDTNNIVYLNGGTLAVNAFIKTRTDTNKLATMNFNGGTLKLNSAVGTLLPLLSGLTANVQAGGAKIDDLGNILTIDQPLLHDAALGVTPDGGLTKIGVGTLTLTGTNTYTGTTTSTAVCSNWLPPPNSLTCPMLPRPRSPLPS